MTQGTYKTYRDLLAWQRAMDVVDAVYKTTRFWPHDELYGLVSQVRRAAVSVPSNIAEGQGRAGIKEFMNHLSIARGSLLEVETQIIIAQRQNYISGSDADGLLESSAEVGRLINGLIRALAAKGS
jgi:four helix bundle protein